MDTGDGGPEPVAELKLAEIGVVIDGDRERGMSDDRLTLREAVAGIGGGGLDCLRLAVRKSPILTAFFLKVSCIRELPLDEVRRRRPPDLGLAAVGVTSPLPLSSLSLPPPLDVIASTPHSPANCRNRLTPPNTPLAALAKLSIALSSSVSDLSIATPSSPIPLAALAHATSFESSTSTVLRSLASTACFTKMDDSLLRQSVCMSADRIDEMTHAVEGWICVFRFAWMAVSSSDKACTMG